MRATNPAELSKAGMVPNRKRRCYQRRSGAPTRGTGPLRLALAGATRSGSAGVGSLARDPLARLRRVQVESIGTTINFRPAVITNRSPERYCPRGCRRPPWLRPGGAVPGPACVLGVPSAGAFAPPFGGYFCERSAVLVERGILARKGLPTQYSDIYVSRIDLDREAGAPRHLGRDYGGAGSAERLVHG